MNNSIILAAALAIVGGYAFADTGEGSENPGTAVVCDSGSTGCEQSGGDGVENGEDDGGEQAGGEEGGRGEGSEGGGEGGGEGESSGEGEGS